METLHHIQLNLTWCENEWLYPTISDKSIELLKQCADVTIDEVLASEKEIIDRSRAFPRPFPIETIRMQKLIEWKPVDKLRRNIISTYPLIHERVLLLMTNFLIHKRQYGTSIEKQFYKNMTVCELIDRILKKRAVAFVGPYDKYLLLSGEEGLSEWEEIGTSEEKPPLVLENCLSYDEMKLSAMVYISGYTECINDGTRKNEGVVRRNGVEEEAVIIGVIGPRFHRRGKMDYEDILITKEQNCAENGYAEVTATCYDMFKSADTRDRQVRKQMLRQMWAEFYQIENKTYNEVRVTASIDTDVGDAQKPYMERYLEVKRLKYNQPIFDNAAYYKRISVIAESTLLEAEYRAKETGVKTAFLNVIGCGLGVWMISGHQADVYVLTFLDRISYLLKRRSLDHVSDVNFAYIKTSPDVLEIFSNTEEHNGQSSSKRWFFMKSLEHPKGGINVQVQNREPSCKLSGEHFGKLLVMTYPWDSNAHPGNEFWYGSLFTSGDPAAACSTQVAELHNAHINPAVSANNVRVVGRYGLKTLAEYCLALIAHER